MVKFLSSKEGMGKAVTKMFRYPVPGRDTTLGRIPKLILLSITTYQHVYRFRPGL